ncbi:MAG: hypothetical protein GC161_00390 [Planctomycetaceae bacterium]|nr:hypothetical protein [Planctomycetaceae bacterium]
MTLAFWILYAALAVALFGAAVVALGLRLRAARVEGQVYAAHRPSRPYRLLGLLILGYLALEVSQGNGVAHALVDFGVLGCLAAVVAIRPAMADRVCAAGGVRLGTRVAPWERLDQWHFDDHRLVVELGNRRGEFALPRDLCLSLRERLERETPRRP